MTTEEFTNMKSFLQESDVDLSEKNLRLKVGSILLSLQALEKKKERINTEIRKQKRSLTKKRLELKKVSKSTQKKLKSATKLQIEADYSLHPVNGPEEFRRLDSILLQESSEMIDN